MRAAPLTSTGPRNLHRTTPPRRPDPHTRWTNRRGPVSSLFKSASLYLWGGAKVDYNFLRTHKHAIACSALALGFAFSLVSGAGEVYEIQTGLREGKQWIEIVRGGSKVVVAHRWAALAGILGGGSFCFSG
jgi:hypothetical protein